MGRLSREQWLWYAAFPVGFLAFTLILGVLTADGSSLVTIYVVPGAIGGAVSLGLVGWWITHFQQPPSKKATDLSVSALFASVLIDTTRYALAVDRGISYSLLETSSLICIVPGFACALYYLGIGREEVARGQKIIIDGWFTLIYVGIGSYSVRNISSAVFHVDLLTPQVWLWLGRVGFQAATLLIAAGVLMTRKQVSLVMPENLETHKETWGESLRGLTFVLTMIGVLLSGYSISVLGGLIAMIVGLLLYPIGWVVTLSPKSKVSPKSQ